MTDWFSNGEAAEFIAASDRGFQYGDGLFETVAIRDGKARLWNYHLDRLAKGCERLAIKMPAHDDLLRGVMYAVQESKVPAAYSVAKIVVSAGSGRRGYGRSFAATPSLLFGAFSAFPPAIEFYRDGIDTVICQTRLAIHSATAGIKTLNRLEQVLARSEFIEDNTFEGLTMDADDNIICGTMSNVFFVRDKSISTPPLDRCGVEGVMRRHVIETLAEQGIQTSIQTTSLTDMSEVDEVFLSNSQFGVMPVKRCMEMQWPAGEVTRRVMSILADNGVAECR